MTAKVIDSEPEFDSDSDADSHSSEVRRRVSSADPLFHSLLIDSVDSDSESFLSDRKRLADARNERRLKSRDRDDLKTLCKSAHLPSDPYVYTLGPVQAPDDQFVPPEDFLSNLGEVHISNVPAPFHQISNFMGAARI